MRHLLWMIFAATMPAPGLAFNVDGFNTNMTKVAVIQKAERKYKLGPLDSETLIAKSVDGGYLSFDFCDDRLASMQKGFAAKFHQVTLLAAEFKSKFGNPISMDAVTRADTKGTIYQWGTWWAAGDEFVSLNYSGDSTSENLSVSYQSRNRCFNVPR